MRSLEGERVLVTGGAGVVGRVLVGRLAQHGAEVLSVDRIRLDKAVVGAVQRRADIAKDDLSFITSFRPRVVFHLAATFERTQESPEFWAANWDDNVVASHRLMSVADRLVDLDAFIFASSYLVYDSRLCLFPRPRSRPVLLSEDDSLDPRNLCGAAKLYAERELLFLSEKNPRVRAVSARIYRVYGLGSRDVISRWVRAAVRGDSLPVYQPENRFDFIFAGDVAEGLFRMALAPQASGPINLGTGVARSAREALALVSNLSPDPLRTRRLRVRGAYEASCADIARLRRLVRWTPKTNLEEGIRLIWSFEEDRNES